MVVTVVGVECINIIGVTTAHQQQPSHNHHWTDRKKHILKYYQKQRATTAKTTTVATATITSTSTRLHQKMNRNSSSSCSNGDHNSKKFLVLITNTACNIQTTTNQNRILTILESNGFKYDTIDGSNPVNKER